MVFRDGRAENRNLLEPLKKNFSNGALDRCTSNKGKWIKVNYKQDKSKKFVID